MPRGNYPYEYLSSTAIDKPLEQIYRDIDDYSMEYFADERSFRDDIDVVVVLPPLHYEGQFVKGVLYTQSADLLHERFPPIGELFFTIANSQWCSYPRSEHASAYFSCYPNPKRDAWFRQTYPDRANKILLPIQDADRTHEYKMAPVDDETKAFDVVCVSRIQELKNIPIIASALKIFRQKYYPIRMVLIPGKPFDLNLNGLTDHETGIWRKVESILTHPRDYIHLVPQANYDDELPKYYANAKLCVLGSLIEGKNRSIYEAAMCDTPSVWFEGFNQFARGGQSPLPDGAGLAAAHFDAECLADTFKEVLDNRNTFTPRISALRVSGRKNFLSRILDAIPYYRDTLPDFDAGRHFANLWLDLAIQHNYRLNLHDFTYDRSFSHSWVRGEKQIDAMMRLYFDAFGLDSRAPVAGTLPVDIGGSAAPLNVETLASMVQSESPTIVVGPSRRRNSMVAKTLHEQGVFIGSQFADVECLPGGESFEDAEFLSANARFLIEHSASYHVWEETVLTLMVQRAGLGKAWGWTDGLTSTLLWQYSQLLPNAQFLYCPAPREEIAEAMRREHPDWPDETTEDQIDEQQSILDLHLPPDAISIADADTALEELEKELEVFQIPSVG